MNLAFDTCRQQKNEEFKTEAAKMLKLLCQRIDGAALLVIDFNIEMLINPNFEIKLLSKFNEYNLQKINEILNSIFVKSINSNDKIDVILLSFSIIHLDLKSVRIFDLQKLEDFLLDNYTFFLNNSLLI
jgi:hypothetical protein